MRTETKERQTDRFTVQDEAGDRYTVSERTEFTQEFPDSGPPAKPVAGQVRYVCANLSLNLLDSGKFELLTDPPKICSRA